MGCALQELSCPQPPPPAGVALPPPDAKSGSPMNRIFATGTPTEVAELADEYAWTRLRAQLLKLARAFPWPRGNLADK